MKNIKQNNVTLKDQIGYGVGVYGYGLTSQMISSYLVFYGTAVLFLPGILIGLIVSLSIIWDAVSDPLMGYISDNTKTKHGKRHIYIFLGTIFMSITNYFLWTASPEMSLYSKFIWLFMNVMLIKTFITIFITPYNALGAEIVTDYDKRTSIQAIKTIFFLAALLSVTAISMFIFFKPTMEYPIGQLNPLAYRNMALTISIFTLVTGLISYFSTLKFKNYSENNIVKTTFKDFIKSVVNTFKCNNFRAVTIGYLFTNLASAIIGTIGLHVFTFTFYMDNISIGIVLGLSISIFGSLIILSFVGFREIIKVHYEIMLIYAVVVGFGTSGLFSLPFSMIADTVDLEELNYGQRNEGLYYGLLNFSYKISQSIAILFFGVMLDLIGFDATQPNQSESTLIILGLLLPIGSIVSFLLSRYFYKGYTLDRNKLNEIQKILISKKMKTPE